MSIPIYKPTKKEADQKFPVDPADGKRWCVACNGCGMIHCSFPEECGLYHAFGNNGDHWRKRP